MRTNQGSSGDLNARFNQSRREIEQYTASSPNAQRDTLQNFNGVVSREKYQKLKDHAQKLKNTLRDYVNIVKDKDKELNLKEELIIKYDNDLKDRQIFGNEEFKSQINELKLKLQKKKTKIRKLKESTKSIDIRLDEQKAGFQIELDRIQLKYEAILSDNKDFEKRQQVLMQENNVLKQALQQRDDQCRYFEKGVQDDRQSQMILENKIKELQEEKKILQLAIENQISKTEELEKIIKLNENRFQQDLNKQEQEKSQLQNEYLSQLNKKKEKIKQMLLQIQQLEQQIAKQQKDEIHFNQIIQENKQEQLRLQNQLEEQRNKTDQAIKEANYKVQEVKELKQKIDSQKSLVQTFEDKLAQYDIQYHIDLNDKQQIFSDIDQLHLENKKLTKLLYDSDQDIIFLKQQHEDELFQIEQRVGSLINQVSSQKDEISEQKKLNSELKKQLIAIEEQSNIYKNKYLKVKQSQKTLQSEQKYLEEKMKLMESERIFEEREAMKTRDYAVQQKQIQQSKIKVLDEIQSMIKQHKKITS